MALMLKSKRRFGFFTNGLLDGSYIADLLVKGDVVVELKSVETLTKAHEAQVLNYLKATGKQLGLLINFGKNRVEHKRFVL